MRESRRTLEFIDIVKEGKFYEERILLWPHRWRAYKSKTTDPVSWTIHRFTKAAARHIPTVPGIYAFLIKPSIPIGLDVSILIYIGKADRVFVE